jgi:four helix bundle protein
VFVATRSELLQRRFISFAVSTGEMARRIPRNPAGVNAARQLARSASAPAADYAEAREAESQHDYVHKMKLCVKELRETQVWIELAQMASGPGLRAEEIMKECDALIAISVACIKKAREHRTREKATL